MKRLGLFLLSVIVLLLVVFINIFVALAVVSMLIVPLTWLYAKVVGQSYNFTIDQSDMLYKLNKFGQWALLIGGSLAVLYFVFYR